MGEGGAVKLNTDFFSGYGVVVVGGEEGVIILMGYI